MAQTWATAVTDGLVHTVFEKGAKEELNETIPFWAALQKSECKKVDVGGTLHSLFLEVGVNQNTRTGDADPSAFETTGRAVGLQMTIPQRRTYSAGRVNFDLWALGGDDAGAYVEPLARETKRMIDTFKHRLNWQLLNGAGDDTIAYVRTSANDATLTLDTPAGMPTKRMGIWLQSMNLTGYQIQERANPAWTIVGVTRGVNSVTTTEGSEALNLDGAIDHVDNDFVVLSLNANFTAGASGMMGLVGIVDDFTRITTFQGVTSASPYAGLLSANIVNRTGVLTPISENGLNRLMDQCEILGGKQPNILTMHTYMRSTMYTLYQPDKRFFIDNEEITLPGGYKPKKMTHNGVPVLVDPLHLRNCIHGLQWGDLRFYHRGPAEGRFLRSALNAGGTISRIDNSPQYEFAYVQIGNMGAERRNSLGRYDDILEATV